MYLINITVINEVGLGLVSKINNKHTNAKVFILITDDTYDIGICFNDFIETGVSGFISKTHSRKQFIHAIRCATEGLVIIPTELLAKLRKVDRKIKVEGKSKLISNKERKILLLAAKGMTNREISEKIHMSQRNVERHLTSIYKKMRVNSRFEAIALGKEIGLIPKFLLVGEWKENFLSLDRAETD